MTHSMWQKVTFHGSERVYLANVVPKAKERPIIDKNMSLNLLEFRQFPTVTCQEYRSVEIPGAVLSSKDYEQRKRKSSQAPSVASTPQLSHSATLWQVAFHDETCDSCGGCRLKLDVHELCSLVLEVNLLGPPIEFHGIPILIACSAFPKSLEQCVS